MYSNDDVFNDEAAENVELVEQEPTTPPSNKQAHRLSLSSSSEKNNLNRSYSLRSSISHPHGAKSQLQKLTLLTDEERENLF